MDMMRYHSFISPEFLPAIARPARRVGSEPFTLELLERRVCMSVTPAPLNLLVSDGLVHSDAVPEGRFMVASHPYYYRYLNPEVTVEHRKPFTETMHRFDGNGQPLTDFRATIDWGDGTTSPGTLVRGEAGRVEVVGSHEFDFGTHYAIVNVTDRTNPDFKHAIQVQVRSLVPALAGRGVDIAPVAGRVFSGVVAEYAGVVTDLLDRYSARIDWGDGWWSQGELQIADDGAIRVIGEHAYGQPGAFDVRVTLGADQRPPDGAYTTHLGGDTDAIAFMGWCGVGSWSSYDESGSGTVRAHATVTPGVLGGEWLVTRLGNSTPFRGPVARFTLTAERADFGDFRADLDWGDGRGASAARIVRESDTTFVVYADQFISTQAYTTRAVVTIHDKTTDDAPLVGLIHETIFLSPPIQFQPFIESNTFTADIQKKLKLGTVTTSELPAGWTENLRGVVQWGDGVESDVSFIERADGQYDVYGTHTYDQTGYDRSTYAFVTVTSDRSRPGDVVPVTHSAWGSSQNVTVLAGDFDGFYLKLVFDEDQLGTWRVRDTRERVLGVLYADDSVTIDSATVQWDESTIQTARVEAVSPGVRYIWGPALFQETGWHSGELFVTSDGVTKKLGIGGEVNANANRPVRPVDPPVVEPESRLDFNPFDITVTKGQLFEGVIGTINPQVDDLKLEDLDINLYWGDGTIGQPVLRRSADGMIEIRAQHVFVRSPGFFSLTVRDEMTGHYYSRYSEHYEEIGGRVTFNVNPAFINADPDFTGNLRQREESTVTLATFTSPDPDALPEDFEVQIDWGDGTSTAGVVSEKFGGGFQVVATKQYDVWGEFEPVITISGPGGTTTTRVRASVTHNPVILTPEPSLPLTGRTIDGTLATFFDDLRDQPFGWYGTYQDADDNDRVLHAGLVDWGDGSIGMAEIVKLADGTFEARGDHTYTRAGEYEVKLIVRRTLYRVGFDHWDTNYRAVALTTSDALSTDDASTHHDYAISLGKVTIPTDAPPASRPSFPTRSVALFATNTTIDLDLEDDAPVIEPSGAVLN